MKWLILILTVVLLAGCERSAPHSRPYFGAVSSKMLEVRDNKYHYVLFIQPPDTGDLDMVEVDWDTWRRVQEGEPFNVH